MVGTASGTSGETIGVTVDTWTAWINISGTTTISTGAYDTWVGWVSISSTSSYDYQPAISDEERARQEQQERDRQHKKEAADRAADLLLLSLLNTAQRKEYREEHQITIKRGAIPKWILKKRDNFNIVECDDCGAPAFLHCVRTPGTPLPDQLAAQYLYLLTCPDVLIQAASHRLYDPSNG